MGATAVCGVDEVGRGPLAGPVVAAAVVLPLQRFLALPHPTGGLTSADFLSQSGLPPSLLGLDDSKRLCASQRRAYRAAIEATAVGVHVGMASPQEIDALNIRQATLLAMSRAIRGLELAADAFILVDGRDLPPDLPCPALAIVRGDQHSLSVAAASIVAKETRDTLMVQWAQRHPGYGWEHNMGYPTAAHRKALATLGVTEQHRRSFAPVRQALANTGTR
ncbi:MAG: ribonuclease HII [Magnetococcales bacterium]|nr:ribonuclease HII [Magnetococcales bacterium]